MSDDWILLQDFDDVERDHSQSRYEMQVKDAGETVFFRETAPMGGNESYTELPTEVVKEASDNLD